ncbi:MAG: hypothetical protein HFACDABA_01766 [Anaerolineales bacterium]|nr:hypothetical protein [Anaerolineales bacterium]
MPRSLLLGLLAYGLLLIGLATLRGDLIALSVPLVLYLFFGLFRAPQTLELDVTRRLSAERIAPHQTVTVTLSVTNRGEEMDEMLVEDVLPEGMTVADGSNRHLTGLARGETRTWTYTISAPRGAYGFESIQIEARDGLGLLSRSQTFAAPMQLAVLPPVLRLRNALVRPRATRVYAGTIPARVGGAGVDFFGVRDYQPGDSPRRINWHVSARQREEIYSNEFEQERVADIGIILDGRDRTNIFSGHSLFEHSVQACAALAAAFLTQGNRVGLLLYGQYLHWTLPGYGKFQREKILHALASARHGGSDVFSNLAHLPAQLFPINSQIVFVSPLANEDLGVLVQLRARGYQVLVVSPDPVSFETSHLPRLAQAGQAARVIRLERELLLGQLRRAGIQILNWDVSQPFDQAARHALSRPPQWARTAGRSAA